MNQLIRQQRRIYSCQKKYSKPIIQRQSIALCSDRINKHFRLPSKHYSANSCYCNDCGKRSKFMSKVFQLQNFRMSNQWRRSKNFRKFRRLIHCIIYIIRYRIVKRIKTKKKLTVKKVLSKPLGIDTIQKQSAISQAITELKSIIRVESVKQKSKQNKQSSYSTLLKGRRNLRQLFIVPQMESPIKQFIIKNSKPNTVHNSPMQSLYDFKISTSFRGQ